MFESSSENFCGDILIRDACARGRLLNPRTEPLGAVTNVCILSEIIGMRTNLYEKRREFGGNMSGAHHYDALKRFRLGIYLPHHKRMPCRVKVIALRRSENR